MRQWEMDLEPFTSMLDDIEKKIGDTSIVLNLVAFEARNIWKRAVMGTVYPPMTKSVISVKYAAAIDNPSSTIITPRDITIDVSSFAGATAIEEGYDAFDMKERFAQSDRVKQGKHGWYLDIPFRHGTPGQPKDGPSPERANFANTMPPAVYAAAKALSANSPDVYGDVNGIQMVKPPVGGMTNPYVHKATGYAGMRKKQSASGQNSYWTFRRVSENSDPNSWQHPGVPPNPVVEGVMQELSKRLPQIVKAAYDQILSTI